MAEGEIDWFWWIFIILIFSSAIRPSYNSHMMRQEMLKDSYEDEYYNNYYTGYATSSDTIDLTEKAPCSCYPDLDCEDFDTQIEAQQCFRFCGEDDPHRLDRDEDGRACEFLP